MLADVPDINTVKLGSSTFSMVGVYITFITLPVALFMAVLNHIYLKIIKYLELAAPVHLENYLLLHELERATGHGLTRVRRLQRSRDMRKGRRNSTIEPTDTNNYLEVEPAISQTEFSSAATATSSPQDNDGEGLALMNQIGQNVLASENIEGALKRAKFWYKINVVFGGLIMLAGLVITLIFLGSFGPERQSRWATAVGKQKLSFYRQPPAHHIV